MYLSKLFCLFGCILILIVSCGEDSTTSSGNGSSADGKKVRGALTLGHDDTTAYAYVFVTEGNTTLSGFEVTINSDTLVEQTISGRNVYTGYLPVESGDICSLVATGDGTELQFTASMPYPFEITSPEIGDEVEALNDLNINWTISQGADGYYYYISEQKDSSGGIVYGMNATFGQIPGALIPYEGVSQVMVGAFNGWDEMDINSVTGDSLPPEGFGCIFIAEPIPVTVVEGEAPPPDSLPQRSGRLYIEVSEGTSPQITWEPSEQVNALMLYQNLPGDDRPLWYISGMFGPPVQYGELPVGASQVFPTSGDPEPLQEGVRYIITIIHQGEDSPSTIIFVR